MPLFKKYFVLRSFLSIFFLSISFLAISLINVNFASAQQQELETLELSAPSDSSLSLMSPTVSTGAKTGVNLGTGVVATKKFTIDQKSVMSTSLARLKAWRKDALNDSRIKIDKVTIRQWLKNKGISEKTYLNPTWSNALERIALQRAVEAGDANLGHTRPNSTSCFSATYGSVSSYAENLAWSSANMTGASAIDMWASEKADYIKQLKGLSHGQTGHYVMLINPSYNAYGFAVTQGFSYKSVAAGEASTKLTGSANATNWKGKFNFDIAIDDAKVKSPGITANTYSNCKSVNKGTKFSFKATLKYRNNTFTVKEKWYSTNSNVLSVTTSGVATAKTAGSARVYFLGQSYLVGILITVPSKIEVYRLNNPYSGEHLYTTSTQERVNCIKTGWKNEGVGWKAPDKTNDVFYRLCYPKTGLHHYTKDKTEYTVLGKRGWSKEGVVCYSATSNKQNIYRLYNPYTGEHFFTANAHEYKTLKTYGWKQEGVGCYATK